MQALSALQIRSCSHTSQATIQEVMTTLLGNTCPADFSIKLLPRVAQCFSSTCSMRQTCNRFSFVPTCSGEIHIRNWHADLGDLAKALDFLRLREKHLDRIFHVFWSAWHDMNEVAEIQIAVCWPESTDSRPLHMQVHENMILQGHAVHARMYPTSKEAGMSSMECLHTSGGIHVGTLMVFIFRMQHSDEIAQAPNMESTSESAII